MRILPFLLACAALHPSSENRSTWLVSGSPYISIEDLQNRAHIGQSIVEMLRGQGALEGLPETSQVDLFSLLG